MHFKTWSVALLAVILSSCSRPGDDTGAIHQHEEAKFQYTAYSSEYEVFAEADPFVISEQANVLAHFSRLADFKPVEAGSVTLVIAVDGNETRQTLAAPTRKGIYSFNLAPTIPGRGVMHFELLAGDTVSIVNVPDITVFAAHKEALEAAENAEPAKTNTSVFTKEQSWKIDFSTDHPTEEPFGQIIKTVAQVQPAPSADKVISAGAGGIISIPGNSLLEGQHVTAGQVLLSLTGSHLAENNIAVKYAEAKNNFLKAEADYTRLKGLAAEKIVSEKDLLAAQNQYENAKALYDNLNENSTAQGQKVTSPATGFVKQLFVKNGAYVDAGQPLLVVSQLQSLLLRADVAAGYWGLLENIRSATIRTLHDPQVYTLADLNGKIVSYGKATADDNHLLPVYLQIENNGRFFPGSYVHVLLKTVSNSRALTVPATALLEEQGHFFVWVQLTPELFEKRPVRIGASDGQSVEIIRGITAGDRIVTRGAIYIKLAQATAGLDAHSGHVH